MGQFDRAFKRLTAAYAADYVRFALGTTPAAVEPLDVATEDKELPALSREVDFVARVRRPEGEALLLLECQTRWAADMPLRMAGYTWRLGERYQLPVYPVLMVLRPGGQLQDRWQMVTWGRPVAECHFRLVPLWQVPAQSVVDQGLVGLYPLLPLMQPVMAAEPAAALQRYQQLISEQVPDGEARADAQVALGVFGTLVWPLKLVLQVLHRRELMLESPFYRYIVRQGLKEGRQKGRQEGLEEGRQEGLEEGRQEGLLERLRKDVVQVLEVRFGAAPAATVARLEQLADLGRLEGLHRRALLVGSAAQFAQELEALPGAPEQVSGST